MNWVVILGAEIALMGTKKECVKFFLKHYNWKDKFGRRYRLFSERGFKRWKEICLRRYEEMLCNNEWDQMGK